jgi:hypothetical protein
MLQSYQLPTEGVGPAALVQLFAELIVFGVLPRGIRIVVPKNKVEEEEEDAVDQSRCTIAPLRKCMSAKRHCRRASARSGKVSTTPLVMPLVVNEFLPQDARVLDSMVASRASRL